MDITKNPIAIFRILKTKIVISDNFTFYSSKPFNGSYELRTLLENHLSSKVTRDLEILDNRIKEGKSRELIIQSLVSESEFEEWYSQIVNEASLILSKQ